jgi:hypothetical protein
LPIMSATAQTYSRGRYSHPGPPWYSPPLSAHSGPDPIGCYCHPGKTVGKPVKILAAYVSPTRPLIGEELSACFGGGMPVLIAGDLNAKHVDWNSWLSTRGGKLLCDYADENSCLIFGPDTPTTNPYSPLATRGVLNIVLPKNLTAPVYLTSCSTLSSDHLPELIGTTCRSSFQHPPDRPDFRLTGWANCQTHLEDQIPLDPELHDGMAIDTCVENLSGAVLKALAASTPKRRQRVTHGLRTG